MQYILFTFFAEMKRDFHLDTFRRKTFICIVFHSNRLNFYYSKQKVESENKV